MIPFDRKWPRDQAATLAIILEASAAKLGNVHPAASFHDMQYGHFAAAAVALGAIISKQTKLGPLVLESTQAMVHRVGCNTSLGTILILSPLAVAAGRLESRGSQFVPASFRDTVQQVLDQLDDHDTELVFQAIRLASAGGMDQSVQNDVRLHQRLAGSLVRAMAEVADFDAVARQYVNGFEDVFCRLLPWFDQELDRESELLPAIVRLQLRWLAHEPDGLIHRKCGPSRALQVQNLAAQALELFKNDPQSGRAACQQLDCLLRSESNRLNPGTTADLIACCLFCRLVCGPDPGLQLGLQLSAGK